MDADGVHWPLLKLQSAMTFVSQKRAVLLGPDDVNWPVQQRLSWCLPLRPCSADKLSLYTRYGLSVIHILSSYVPKTKKASGSASTCGDSEYMKVDLHAVACVPLPPPSWSGQWTERCIMMAPSNSRYIAPGQIAS